MMIAIYLMQSSLARRIKLSPRRPFSWQVDVMEEDPKFWRAQEDMNFFTVEDGARNLPCRGFHKTTNFFVEEVPRRWFNTGELPDVVVERTTYQIVPLTPWKSSNFVHDRHCPTEKQNGVPTHILGVDERFGA